MVLKNASPHTVSPTPPRLIEIGIRGLPHNRGVLLAFGAAGAAGAHELLRHVHIELLQRLVGELHHKLITAKEGGVASTHVPGKKNYKTCCTNLVPSMGNKSKHMQVNIKLMTHQTSQIGNLLSEIVARCWPTKKRSFPKENSKAPPCSPSCSKLRFPASPGINREKWLHLA